MSQNETPIWHNETGIKKNALYVKILISQDQKKRVIKKLLLLK